MDDPHGLTRVGPPAVAPPQGPPSSPDDYHLQEVRRAVGAEYDVFGEICEVGEGMKSGVAYLARRSGSMRLDALRLLPAGEYVEVLGRMGDGLPTGADLCPKCSAPIRAGVRFCGNCRANLSAVRLTDAPDSISVAEWLEVKSEAGHHNYELIGQLLGKPTHGAPAAPDSTTLFVARTSNTSRIVALRLERGVAGSPSVLSLDQTRMLSELVASLVEGPREPFVAPVAVAPAKVEDVEPLPIAPIIPQPVAPPPPPPTPPWTPTTGTPSWVRIAMIALSGAAVIAALAWLVSAMSNRGSQPDDQALASARADSIRQDSIRADSVRLAGAGAVVDSATVQINPGLPTGASITVDGAPVSRRVIRLAPGTHTLVASARGFKPATQNVDLRPGQRLTWPSRVEAEARLDTVAVAPRATGGCAGAAQRSDWAQALALCSREAGSSSSAFAERTLGIMHERGLGVAQDLPVAGEWYSASARHGDAQGQYLYGRLLQDGRGVRANLGEAVQWYTRSAEQGNDDAQYALGMLYARGEGVAKSDAEAIKWLQRAAAKGNDRARQELARRGVRP